MISMKMARVGANLTMVEMAKKLDVHPQTYSNWEKHPEEVSIKCAKLFSQIVGIPVDDIFFIDDSN